MAVIEGRRGRFLAAAVLTIFGFAALARVSSAQGVVDTLPPEVESVSFRVASPYVISYEELAGLVTVHPGDLLTRDAVQESMRRLQRKSPFRKLAVYVRRDNGKARVLFYLEPLPVVAEVTVSGQRTVPSARIAAASRIRRGVAADEKVLSDAEKSVLALLRSRGFLAATVSVSASCSLDTGAGKVRITVAEGSPAPVGELRVEGAKCFPRERIERILGVSPGEAFDFQTWEWGRNRLRKAYKRDGFLTVHLADTADPCSDRERLCLTVRVEEGPRYAVEWKGADHYSVETLADTSQLYSGDVEASEGGLVHDVRERLLSFYRLRDYFRVAVGVAAERSAGGGRILRITVQEGERGFLKAIRFAGNASISAKRLRKQMLSTERGPLHYVTGSGKFDESVWNADLAALIGLYQKEGFARARIASVDTRWDEHGGMTATIHIHEGPRFTVREIHFRGNDHFLRQELLAKIGNRVGRAVDYAGLDHDQEAIAAFYRDAGYLDAAVASRFEPDPEGDTAVVAFDIREGPRYRLGNVVVRGNVLTDSAVVHREMTVPPGAPIGERDLLAFQRAVYATGLYRSVRLRRVERTQEGVLDLIVEVDETSFFEVEFGAGYGTDTGVRGFVGATHRNLDGKGRRFTVRVSASQKEQVYLADLREPWIFGNRWKWEGGATASYQEAERESFKLRKTSVVASITKTIFNRSSVSVQHELSRDDVFDVNPGAVLSPEDQGSATISALRGLFVLDFRDDPFNPTRGSFNSGSLEFASSSFGSEVDYVKVTGQSSWYIPVFRRFTLVVSGRAGLVRPLGDTPEVPIQKRFFLGGRTTVRGFKEESLGPHGPDGAPTGGDYMVNGNAELRVPLQYGFIAAVFLDTGSVWFQGDPTNGFDLRKSAGVGLRYVTPVGPISLDYGWKLDRRQGESPSEWHFTIGAVF